jgi:hypothetical protein
MAMCGQVQLHMVLHGLPDVAAHHVLKSLSRHALTQSSTFRFYDGLLLYDPILSLRLALALYTQHQVPDRGYRQYYQLYGY